MPGNTSPGDLPAYPSSTEKVIKGNGSDKAVGDVEAEMVARPASLSSSTKVDNTHRMLKSRHIQLIGIGGTIGTVLYVSSYLF